MNKRYALGTAAAVGLLLALACITVNIYFPEATVKQAAAEIVDEIRDLVLTYGQPERFEFRLESVPRKGVARTFSLKAVDNLTVLSSGQQALIRFAGRTRA